MVSDDLEQHSKLTDPSFKNGCGHREGLLVGDGHYFSVLGEGVGPAEDVLFAGLLFVRPKQVSMHSLLWFGAFGKRREQHGRLCVVSRSPDLTTVTFLNVFLDIGIHSVPVVALGNFFTVLAIPSCPESIAP